MVLCSNHGFYNEKVGRNETDSFFFLFFFTNQAHSHPGLSSLGVPDFGRSLNLITTKGEDHAQKNTGTTRFSDPPSSRTPTHTLSTH